MKTVKLPEFEKYRKLKKIILETIQYQEDMILLWKGLWDYAHEKLYQDSVSLGNSLIKTLEKIITRETKLQLPSHLNDDVEFVL